MSTAVAKLTNDKVPAHVTKGSNRGNEEVKPDDLSIPRVKLLQKMSDEVDRHHANYIEGAKDGDFINSLTHQNYGTELYVINLKFTDDFVVWRSRDAGGGLLGSFKTLGEANAAIAEQDKPEDYEVKQTHSHVLLIKDPDDHSLSNAVVMDFNSSKLRPSRNWNTQINIKGGDRFSGLWRLFSVATKNRAGAQFMNLDVEFVGWVTDEDYKQAEKIFEAFNK